MKRIGVVFCLLASLLLLVTCASIGFLMAKPKVTLLGETYTPKDGGAKIDVYITNKPTQKYLEFARITCGNTNDKWNLEQITKKGRKIEADGIIIVGKANSTGVRIPMRYST